MEDVYIKQIEFPIAIDGAANANETKVHLSDGRTLSGVQSASVIADCDNVLRFNITGILMN